MSRVTRDTFIDSFGPQGLDLDKLGADATTALQKAGVGADALATLAGADHKIAGHDDLSALFDLIDRVDHDGHANSLATTTTGADGKALPTASGEVWSALKNQLEKARLGGPVSTKAPEMSAPKLPSQAQAAASLDKVRADGFTDVHLVVAPYVNQQDPNVQNYPYPKSPPEAEARALGKAGCAPCSLAILDAALRRSPIAPSETADFAVRNGVSGSPKSVGTDVAGLARAWAEHRGFELTEATSKNQHENVDALKAGLLAGGVALVSVGVDARTGRGHFTDRGHVVVVNGCAMRNGEEWFAVDNPGRRDQSKPHSDLLGVDANVMQVPGALHGVGQVWISRSQLEAEMKYAFVMRNGGES
jgi:hypothetical protein